MEVVQSVDFAYSASGFVVGLLVGLTGVGGGSLMTPLLILLFGVHPATAVGTDLLYAAATKTGGSLVHGLNRTIDWVIVRRLACGSVPTTALTLIVLSWFSVSSPTTQQLITLALGIVLFFTAASLIFRQQIVASYSARARDVTPQQTARLTILVGAVLGVLVSISSVGAGAIGVTALILLYPNLPAVRIVGSDIAHAVPLTLVAGLGHWFLGSVDMHILYALLVGSLPGIVCGSLVSLRMRESALRVLLALALIVAGTRLIAQSHPDPSAVASATEQKKN